MASREGKGQSRIAVDARGHVVHGVAPLAGAPSTAGTGGGPEAGAAPSGVAAAAGAALSGAAAAGVIGNPEDFRWALGGALSLTVSGLKTPDGVWPWLIGGITAPGWKG